MLRAENLNAIYEPINEHALTLVVPITSPILTKSNYRQSPISKCNHTESALDMFAYRALHCSEADVPLFP
jgi:hypothetical protein